jgi:hypothetical protein
VTACDKLNTVPEQLNAKLTPGAIEAKPILKTDSILIESFMLDLNLSLIFNHLFPLFSTASAMFFSLAFNAAFSVGFKIQWLDSTFAIVTRPSMTGSVNVASG